MGIEERKKREKEQRKNTIINAALQVFLKKDVSGATMEEIAAKAELSKATLYLYFKNKEELFLNVLIIVFQKYAEILETNLSKESNTVDRMRSVGKSYLEFYGNFHSYFKLMNTFDSPTDFDFSDYAMSRDLLEANARIWELVCRPIKEGIAEGILKADTIPLEIGITLWTASTGVINLWDHYKSTPHPSCDPTEIPSDSTYGQMLNVDFERILHNLWDAVFSSITVTNQ